MKYDLIFLAITCDIKPHFSFVCAALPLYLILTCPSGLFCLLQIALSLFRNDKDRGLVNDKWFVTKISQQRMRNDWALLFQNNSYESSLGKVRVRPTQLVITHGQGVFPQWAAERVLRKKANGGSAPSQIPTFPLQSVGYGALKQCSP